MGIFCAKIRKLHFVNYFTLFLKHAGFFYNNGYLHGCDKGIETERVRQSSREDEAKEI